MNIISFVLTLIVSAYAQVDPVSFIDWDSNALTIETCQTVGGYDSSTSTIKIYGGTSSGVNSDTSDTAFMKFDPSDGTNSQSNTSPNAALTATGNTAQFIGQNTIYFEVSENIEGIDMETDTRSVYATLDATTTQTSPGLCVDNDAQKLYSVGNGEIEQCTLVSDGSGVCTATSHGLLNQYQEPACLYTQSPYIHSIQFDLITGVVYDGALFIFGGLTANDNQPQDTIFYCMDPTIAQNCTTITPTLTAARGGIRAVTVECFDNQFVYLLGGEGTAQNPSAQTELFNLQTQTIAASDPFNSIRSNFVAVFDPVSEVIFAFGGIKNQAGNDCWASYESTNVGAAGICQTNDPTIDPTSDPTARPTNDPTTTTNPTMVPSMNPSVSPTTMNPSAAPTGTPPTVTTKSPEPYDPEVTDGSTPPGVYVVLFVLLVIVCCIIIICAFVYRNDEEKEREYGAEQASNQKKAVPMKEVASYETNV